MASQQGGKVIWELDGDNSNLLSSLDDAEGAVKSTASTIDRVSASISNTIGKTFSDIGSILSNSVTAGASAAAGAIVSLGIKGLSTGSYMQSLQIQMNGLTKSVELGAKAMQIAQKYWENNPFQRVDVAATTKTLLAFGLSVNDLADDLKILGNVSLTSGVPLQSLGSIFGQVAAQGRLMGGDIVQLTQNGVAILPALQKMLHKTADQVREMASDGEIDFATFKKAMESLVDPKIVEQMNNTIPRQLDRLRGAITSMSLALVSGVSDAKLGFIAEGKGILQAATTFTKQLADTLKVPEINKALGDLGKSFAPVIDYFSKFFKVVDDHSQVSDIIVAGLGAIEKAGAAVIPVIGLLIGSLGGLAAGIPVLGPLLSGVTAPLGLIAGTMALVVIRSEELRSALSEGFSTIGDAISEVLPQFSGFNDQIAEIGDAIAPLVGPVAEAIANGIRGLAAFFDRANISAESIINTVKTLAPFIIPAIAVIALAFGKLFSQIPIVGGLIGGLSDTFNGFSKSIGNAFGSGTQAALSAFGSAISNVVPLVDSLVKGAVIGFDKIKNSIGPLKEAGQNSLNFLKTSIIGLSDEISKRFPAAGDVINSASGTIRSSLSSISGDLSRFKANVELNVLAATESFKLSHPKIVEFASTLKDNVSSAAAVAIPKLQAIGNVAKDAIGKGFDFIGGAVSRAGGLIKSGMQTIGSAVLGGVTALVAGGALMGDELESRISSIADTITEKGPEILTNITNTITSATTAITEAAPQVLAVLPALITQIAQFLIDNGPMIIQAFTNIVLQLISVLTQPDTLTLMVTAFITLATSLMNAIFQIAPALLEAFFQVVTEMINQISQPDTLNMIIDNTVTFILKIMEILIDNIPTLVNAMITLLDRLIDKITEPDTLQKLIEATITLIVTIVVALIGAIPKLIEAGVKLIIALAKALTRPETIDAILGGIGQIIKAIWDAITKTDWLKLGGDIVKGLWDGISNLAGWIGGKLKGFGDGVLKGIKDFFGIHSPSRLMRDEVGMNLGLGIAEGITRSTASAVATAKNAASQIYGAFSDTSIQDAQNNLSFQSQAPVFIGDQAQSVGSTKTISITQYNTVNTDLDMDQVNRDLTWELNKL